MDKAVANGINLRKAGDDRIGITLDERTMPATIEAVWDAFGIQREDKDYTPRHDPARVLHDEAERGRRDDACLVGRILIAASLYPKRSSCGLHPDDRRSVCETL